MDTEKTNLSNVFDKQSLSQLIKKSLEHYDKQNYEYRDYIMESTSRFKKSEEQIVAFIKEGKEREEDWEFLGYFDNNSKIWVWGWLISNINSSETVIARELLNYALKLEPSTNAVEHYMLKGFLINSRTLIEDDTQLDVNLAIISYLLNKKIKFIYPKIRYNDESKTKYITYYYLIK
jgi:hypothetical protein